MISSASIATMPPSICASSLGYVLHSIAVDVLVVHFIKSTRVSRRWCGRPTHNPPPSTLSPLAHFCRNMGGLTCECHSNALCSLLRAMARLIHVPKRVFDDVWDARARRCGLRSNFLQWPKETCACHYSYTSGS